MKKLKLPTEPKQPEINWDTPQWVISDDYVVLTTGSHDDDCFDGTCMPCVEIPKGDYDTYWNKSEFRRLDFDIPFTISNKED